MTPLEKIQSETAARAEAWNALPAVERLARLESERRDILNQIRRQVHTSRSSGSGYLNRLERRIAALKQEVGSQSQ